MSKLRIKGWPAIANIPAAPRYERSDAKEGAQWPLPPDWVVRVDDPEQPYVVDVEIARDDDWNPVPIGVAVRYPHPTESQQRFRGQPRWSPDIVPAPVSTRDIRRLTLKRYVDAALAFVGSAETKGKSFDRVEAVRRVLVPKGLPSRGDTSFYEDIANAYREFARRGDNAVSGIIERKLAEGVEVDPQRLRNRVHQWIYRARDLGFLDESQLTWKDRGSP